MTVKNRIKELRWVPADSLLWNDKNWRLHPDNQRKHLSTILEGIGYSDALIAREDPDGTLHLIDGHLRADMADTEDVPVLVLDVDEKEADLLLAALDSTSKMANVDEQYLKDLLEEISTNAGQEIIELVADIERLYDIDIPEPNLGVGDFDGVGQGDEFVIISFKLTPEQYEDKRDIIEQVIELMGITPHIDQMV